MVGVESHREVAVMTILVKYENVIDKKTERWRTSDGSTRRLVPAGQAKAILRAYHAAVVRLVKRRAALYRARGESASGEHGRRVAYLDILDALEGT